MATVEKRLSPQAMLDYLNSITLPAEYGIIDKGGHYTINSQDGGVFDTQTVFDEAGLQAALDGLVGTLDEVVAKGPGGHLTFYSLTDVIAGSPGLSMIIAYDEQGVEDALNSLPGTLEYIAEHATKTLIFYS